MLLGCAIHCGSARTEAKVLRESHLLQVAVESIRHFVQTHILDCLRDQSLSACMCSDGEALRLYTGDQLTLYSSSRLIETPCLL